jgi:hypothetical protein
VTVFKGVPGGVLWFDPTIERRTSVDPADLSAAQRSDLDTGKRFSSKGSADAYVRRLRDSARKRNSPTTTTTTTVPAPTSVPPAPALRL